MAVVNITRSGARVTVTCNECQAPVSVELAAENVRLPIYCSCGGIVPNESVLAANATLARAEVTELASAVGAAIVAMIKVMKDSQVAANRPFLVMHAVADKVQQRFGKSPAVGHFCEQLRSVSPEDLPPTRANDR